MRKEVAIIGAGPGSIHELTTNATRMLQECAEVYAFDRIAQLLQGLREDIQVCSIHEIVTKVNASKAPSIAILVSGDTGFFSMTQTLKAKLEKDCHIEVLCGVSSLQYFCSKIGLSYESLRFVSLHGRNRNILGDIAYNPHVFALTGGDHSADQICKELLDFLPDSIRVTVGEYLSMKEERIVTGSLAEIAEMNWSDLAVILFENPDFIQKETPLFDQDFIRDQVPMTKEEVRWISVNHLQINPQDILFDIGAGTGSVSVEMARKAYYGVVYAIEKTEKAFALLNQNRTQLGAYNIIPIRGEALSEIEKLPIPDGVFIGGSGGDLEEILRSLIIRNNRIKLVINAVTLETLTLATQIFKEMNLQMKITCVNCARNSEMGSYNLMVASNPVYIIKGEYHES